MAEIDMFWYSKTEYRTEYWNKAGNLDLQRKSFDSQLLFYDMLQYFTGSEILSIVVLV